MTNKARDPDAVGAECERVFQHLVSTDTGIAIIEGGRNAFPLEEFVDGVLESLEGGGENVPFKSLQEYAERSAETHCSPDYRRFCKAVKKACVDVRTRVQLIQPARLRRKSHKTVSLSSEELKVVLA